MNKKLIFFTLLLSGMLQCRAFAAEQMLTAASLSQPAEVQSSASNEEAEKLALAKATQNPVADLISVPFQNNFGLAYGPRNYSKDSRVQNILNVQPVIPIHLNEDWNLINRTILPIVEQPFPGHKDAQKWGLGDLNTTLFMSPAKSEKLIWGLGPILGFPSATDSEILGTQKWTAGPSAVALTMKGPWVVGALVNQQWSYAGSEHRSSVNLGLLQPFINYNLKDGWALGTSPVITANWANHVDGQCWTVPVGGGISKIVKIKKLPLKLALNAYYNIMHPTFAPDWVLQGQVTFLFPSGKKK